jgi:hypothetical protein
MTDQIQTLLNNALTAQEIEDSRDDPLSLFEPDNSEESEE